MVSSAASTVVSSRDYKSLLYSRISIIAEWAIARLQIEGARQKTLGVHQDNALDMKPELTLPNGGATSASDPQDASNHLAEQDPSLTSVEPVNPGAPPSKMISVYGSYKCISGKSSGRLSVTSHDVRFEKTLGLKDQWKMEYDIIHRIEKVCNSDYIPQSLLVLLSLTSRICSY